MARRAVKITTIETLCRWSLHAQKHVSHHAVIQPIADRIRVYMCRPTRARGTCTCDHLRGISSKHRSSFCSQHKTIASADFNAAVWPGLSYKNGHILYFSPPPESLWPNFFIFRILYVNYYGEPYLTRHPLKQFCWPSRGNIYLVTLRYCFNSCIFDMLFHGRCVKLQLVRS